jgi:membrane-bound ClpP family serine protease
LASRRAGDPDPVETGTSLFLIAVGAILYFAVHASISGLSIATVGIILMVIGVIGLLISLFFLSSWRRRGAAVEERPVTRTREYY